MDEMIAYSGLPCQSCGIYLASREQDPKKKHKMRIDIAQQIKKQHGQDCKAEDINDCDGCKTEGGRLYSECRTCQIRQCAPQKGIENCAHCSEYPCEMLKKFFVTDPEAKKRLDQIRNAP